MKVRPTSRLFACALACAWQGVACAHLQLVADSEPQRVFCGEARSISLVFSNAGSKNIEASLRMRLSQASSATVVTLGERAWKTLTVLPGQTVLDSATLDFPAVKAETRFIVQWFEGTNKVVGTTDVLVYPTNLLADLKPLLGDDDHALGALDPQNQIKPSLTAAKVGFVDLGEASLDEFRGKLAIVGPFASKEQMPAELAGRIQTIARKGVAVVWMQPPPDKRAKLQPSFYTVPFGDTAVVVVQPQVVAGLADSPQSQLNLIRFCDLALRPESPHLPYLNPEP